MKIPSRSFLQELAKKHKLELLGIVALGKEPEFARFEKWLEDGFHADMEFMARNLACREDPRTLQSGAQTALIFGYQYYQGDKAQKGKAQNETRVAQYARLKDYHKFLRRHCSAFWKELEEHFPNIGSMRVTVDSAPLLERALASRTAEGFIGKNTLYIHPKKGSYFLLGEILSDSVFPTDTPSAVDPKQRTPAGGCGSCKRCQVNCPTGALDEAYRLDAKKCIAYYTIEHRGIIPIEFWHGLKLYFFGCDICQLVCPYNRGQQAVKSEHLKLIGLPPLAAIASMNQAEYEQWFGGTPMTRAKKDGLRRNALISMVVNDHEELPKTLSILKEDDSPLIQGTLQQISDYRSLREGEKNLESLSAAKSSLRESH
ncbi:MAG: tRNA epoxyqueuosine(34) reductase QueG [Oligoflexales bacterium]|nr:tRNA epoxyqueuosine(34) reductase QueG [Oligoflexales bacterium]